MARRMVLVFNHFYLLSLCGVLAVWIGYDFFHTKNPNGGQGVVFLILVGATFFFLLQLIGAFTDPLSPAHLAPLTDRQKRMKRILFIMLAFLYVGSITPLILILVGSARGFLIFGYGLVAAILLLLLLDIFFAIYKVSKLSNRPEVQHMPKA